MRETKKGVVMIEIKLRKIKRRIIGEKFTIFGCTLVIMVYISGLIGMFISPNIYFSDIYSSTTITALTVIILFLTIENHHRHVRSLREQMKEVRVY